MKELIVTIVKPIVEIGPSNLKLWLIKLENLTCTLINCKSYS